LNVQKHAEAMIAPGTLVDNFKVARLVGRGGMGEVYLARDMKLGRKVALKIVHPETLGDATAVERFQFEARVTARFSHPHIVTIFAVGEHHGSPYVALEYLEGQTLRERMEELRPSVKETLRIALAIAEALAEAHRHKVLHRDLKPENVLLPRDGRLRVVDFGLAKSLPGQEAALAQTARQGPTIKLESTASAQFISSGGVAGTPLYMAPEQWMDEEHTSAIDVWALGTILYELICGHPPYDEQTVFALCAKVCSLDPTPGLTVNDDVPTELEELVAGCLVKNPQQRPSADSVVEALHGLVYRGASRLEGEVSPFRGLLPFTERHSGLFFGRDGEIAAFLERTRVEPVLPVVGPSGAGKSSFVQAGVFPRLREQGRWMVLALRPGRQPFDTLASRVIRGETDASYLSASIRQTRRSLDGERPRQTMIEEETLSHQLRESPGRLALLLHQLAERDDVRVLLFVDQLEELYTLVDDDGERRAFMEAICGAADDPDAPVRVVFSLRDDFMVRLAETSIAREALGHLTVLRNPGPAALKEILTRPLKSAGYRYEDPELASEMVAAVGGEPSCLPLLQFACSQLWERRDRERRVLTRASYAAMGGVEGALARHADSILEGLTPQQIDAARQIFLRLVTPEGTRQVVPRTQLIEGLDEVAIEVLDRLVNERAVLVRKGRERHGGAEVELVHESLIRNWKRLRRWIDEGREEVAFLAEVSQAAQLWEKRGSRREEVWQGDALRDAMRKAERLTGMPESVRRFLEAGRAKQLWKQRRRRFLTLSGVGLLTLVAVVAVIVAAVVIGQAKEVRLQRNRAEEKGAEAQREGARAAIARGDLLETRAKLRGSLESQDSALARVLWLQLQENPQIGSVELGIFIKQLAIAPDGGTVAAAGSNGLVYLVDVQTQAVRHLRGHTDIVYTTAFSPDGRRLATGTSRGDVGLWDLERDTFTILRGHKQEPAGKVTSVAFSPDGQLLASASNDRTIRLWDVGSGAEKIVLDTENRGGSVTFDPEGRLLASTGADSLIRLWDVASAAEKLRLSGHAATTSAVAFSGDGRMIASTSHDRTVRLWDAKSGEQVRELGGLTDIGTGVAFSPDGKQVAAGSYDRTVRVWDTATGSQIKSIAGHRDIVTAVAFGPAGRVLYSAGADKTIRIWNLEAGEPRAVRGGHATRALGVAFSPGGELLASVGTDKSVRLWDVESGALLQALTGHGAIVSGAAFSPDGNLLASGSIDGTVRLWDVATGNEVDVLGKHETGVYDVAFSPDGNTLASGCNDNTVRLWDVGTGTERRKLEGHKHKTCSLDFSPDGRFLASGSRDTTVRIWDGFTGEPIETLTGHKDWACPVRFDPAGKRLATASSDKTVLVWDVDTWDSKLAGRHGGNPHAMWFADDQLAAIVKRDQEDPVVLWNRSQEQEIPIELNGIAMRRAAYSPDGTLVATSTDEGNVILWDVTNGRRVWRAPLLKRDPPAVLTHLGWQSLGPSSAGELTPETKWRAAIEDRVSIASQSADGKNLCARTHGDEIELWSLTRDERLFSDRIEGLSQVVALPDGCLALTTVGEVRLYRSSGSHQKLFDGANAVSFESQRQQILVATDREVRIFDVDGNEAAVHEVGRGVTALTRIGDLLVLGFQEGNIQLLSSQGAAAGSGLGAGDFSFEEVPSSSVRRLLAGPMETLVVGYDNGFLGIWSLRSGTLLHHFRLHGPLEHMLLDGSTLYTATRLGDHQKLDLGVLGRDYCDLMREVWQAVPVVWSEGRAMAQPPPTDHECSSP
jgi:WD40 repeat protein